MRENVTDVEFRNNFLFQFLKYRSLLLLKLNMKLNNIYSLQNFYNLQKQNYKKEFKNQL